MPCRQAGILGDAFSATALEAAIFPPFCPEHQLMDKEVLCDRSQLFFPSVCSALVSHLLDVRP